MIMTILLVLIGLAALAALESRPARVSIIAFGLAGFGFCLAYIMLGSWDLALVQLAVEIGLLVYLALSLNTQEAPAGNATLLYLGLFVFAVVFAGFAYLIFQNWPSVFVIRGVVQWPGLFELIGTAAALFAAVVGALTVLRPEDKR